MADRLMFPTSHHGSLFFSQLAGSIASIINQPALRTLRIERFCLVEKGIFSPYFRGQVNR
eukprot:scaffold16981_cov38-Cyclotella_meneghiniana.AAC.4